MNDNMQYAPIILFVYNRPDHTRQTLEALSNNVLSDLSDLIIYADGPKENSSPEIIEKIRLVRAIAHEKQWCKTVTVIESDINRGLADSIISGVTEVVNKYGKVIVLEDDIVTGKHFLEYMNDALEIYKDEKKVYHVTGWRNPVKKASEYASYLYPSMDCWGWATWADRWKYFKKDPSYYKSTFTNKMKFQFNINGTDKSMWSQIEDNALGRINTWAIFWYASIFLQGGLCLAPTKSIVKNIGLDNTGVHCGIDNRREIKYNIDRKISVYPKRITINRKEFKKNMDFLNLIYGNTLRKKIMKNFKRIVKSILPESLYNFLKRIYK